MTILLLFYWDSPLWYALNNNEAWALESFKQYHGVTTDQSQLHFTLQQLDQKPTITRAICSLFSSKAHFQPFIILNSLFLLSLLCGKFAVDFYAVDVFLRFGYNMSEYIAVVVAALLSVLGSIFLVILVKHLMRKTLLVATSIMMGMSLILLGVCSYSHHHG